MNEISTWYKYMHSFFSWRLQPHWKNKTVGLENCAISEITLAELVFGAENSNYPKNNYKLIETFSEQVAILPILDAITYYGKEKVRLRKNGKMISDFDLLIGTTWKFIPNFKSQNTNKQTNGQR